MVSPLVSLGSKPFYTALNCSQLTSPGASCGRAGLMRRPDRALFAGEGSATAAPAAAVGVAPFGEATQTWGPVASSSQTRSYRTSERIWYEVGER